MTGWYPPISLYDRSLHTFAGIWDVCAYYNLLQNLVANLEVMFV
jgi:hypothetical protein